MDQGFLPLSRQFFAHEFWSEKRVYSRGEAWLDMLQMAQWQDGFRIIKGKHIPVGRGEFVGSLRFLGNRWDWSPMKVQRFMDTLKNETMTRQETRQGETVVTILNYNTYNNPDLLNGTGGNGKSRQRRDSGETAARQRKKGKEGKEGEQLNGGSDDPVGDHSNDDFYRPSKAELTHFIVEHLGCQKSDADHVWNVWEENDWTRSQAGKRVPIKKWKLACNTWKSGSYFPSLKIGRRRDVPEPKREPSTEFLCRMLSEPFKTWADTKHPNNRWMAVGDVPQEVRDDFRNNNTDKIYNTGS